MSATQPFRSTRPLRLRSIQHGCGIGGRHALHGAGSQGTLYWHCGDFGWRHWSRKKRQSPSRTWRRARPDAYYDSSPAPLRTESTTSATGCQAMKNSLSDFCCCGEEYRFQRRPSYNSLLRLAPELIRHPIWICRSRRPREARSLPCRSSLTRRDSGERYRQRSRRRQYLQANQQR